MSLRRMPGTRASDVDARATDDVEPFSDADPRWRLTLRFGIPPVRLEPESARVALSGLGLAAYIGAAVVGVFLGPQHPFFFAFVH